MSCIYISLTLLIELWHLVETRRQYFEKYAEENKFDPSNPNNWYLHARTLSSLKVHSF